MKIPCTPPSAILFEIDYRRDIYNFNYYSGGSGGWSSGGGGGGGGWNNYDSYGEHGAHSQPIAQSIAYSGHHKVARR